MLDISRIMLHNVVTLCCTYHVLHSITWLHYAEHITYYTSERGYTMLDTSRITFHKLHYLEHITYYTS